MLGVGDSVQLGMTATLTLFEQESERVARVPLSALFNQGAGPELYVADAKTGTVTLKPVTVKAYESNVAAARKWRVARWPSAHAVSVSARNEREDVVWPVVRFRSLSTYRTHRSRRAPENGNRDMSEATTLRLMPIYDVPCGNDEVRSGWLHYCGKRGYI